MQRPRTKHLPVAMHTSPLQTLSCGCFEIINWRILVCHQLVNYNEVLLSILLRAFWPQGTSGSTQTAPHRLKAVYMSILLKVFLTKVPILYCFCHIMSHGSDINNNKETLCYAIMSYMIGVGRTTQAEMAANPLLAYHVLDLNCAARGPCLAIVARPKTGLANIPPQNAELYSEQLQTIYH